MNFSPIIIVGGEPQSVFIEILLKAFKKIRKPIILISSKTILKKNIIDKLDEGINVIFDIDWQGTEQIIKRNLNYKLISIFILPPSKKVLHERLSNRDMKDKLIVEERMKQFDKDILHWKNYNYVVINDELKNCYDKIVNILDAELNNKKSDYDKAFVENHIKKLL